MLKFDQDPENDMKSHVCLILLSDNSQLMMEIKSWTDSVTAAI